MHSKFIFSKYAYSLHSCRIKNMNVLIEPRFIRGLKIKTIFKIKNKMLKV